MSRRIFSVKLPVVPNEMAREEIRKQVVFLSRDIGKAHFSTDNQSVEFEAREESGEQLTVEVKTLALRIERALRNLERKSRLSYRPEGNPALGTGFYLDGCDLTGNGQVILHGAPLALFRYFDRVFEGFGSAWSAQPLQAPVLIPDSVLARCDYFRSFPQYVTFATHLQEDVQLLNAFRERHGTASELDDQALRDMERPDTCLSPAMCYHVYHWQQNRAISSEAQAYGICGPCFRYESGNMSSLKRLWNFTMREVVFLGARESVLQAREKSIEMMGQFLRDHRLAGEIRTASDPFFVAPDAVAKTHFQLSSESKFEIALPLADGDFLAVGSHNYHSDFFGRAFNITVEGAAAMHSVCVAFGLERWVFAFMQQHGSDPSRWPDAARLAPEIRAVSR
jgi:seryl-tRNA synthetase